MFQASAFSFLVILSYSLGLTALASHPNEGALSLDSLIGEALENNPEIKRFEAGVESSASLYKATLGAFSPDVSLEGGPLKTKYDTESNSGTAAYGRVDWNLYRGGKDQALRKKKELEGQLLKSQFEQTKSKIARDVARVYYELEFILESISIQVKAIDLNHEQMKLAHTKRSAGFTSEADVIEFELRDSTIQSDLRALRQNQEAKSRELSVLLGRNESASDLLVKGHLELNAPAVNKEKVLHAISDLNPEILEFKSILAMNQQDKNIVRSGFYPKLDLQGKFGKIANEEKVFSEKSNYSIGVMLNIPLFSGFTSTHELDAITYRNASLEYQSTKNSLNARSETETLFSQLSTLRERLELEEKTLARSEQYYNLTVGEYKRGVKNSPDMVGASERLLNSRIRNLEYRRDYQLTLLSILAEVGARPGDSNWLASVPAQSATSREKVIASGEVLEECMNLLPNNQLAYSFESRSPVDFNIHYHQEKNILYPVKKENSSQQKGFFKPTTKQEYCLMWTNKTRASAAIRYEFKVEEI